MRYKISHYIHRFIDNGEALLWSQRYILFASALWCWKKRFDIRSKVSDFLNKFAVLFLTLFKQMMNAVIFAETMAFDTTQIKNYFLIVWSSSFWIKQTSSLVVKNGNYTTLSAVVCLLFKVASTRYLPKSVSHECICNTSFFFVRNIALAKWHCG